MAETAAGILGGYEMKKKYLKPEIFKKLIETISFSDIEEKKLTKLFFESYYGAAEFQKVECFVDCLNSFGEKMKVKKINVPEFHGKFALSDSKEILSAVKFICENSESQNITTNFPFFIHTLLIIYFFE